MKKILLLVGVCTCIFTTYAANSPVVQVISYKEPLGLYFSLQGWGSGSIVDNQGHIITNNHVVDDGAGGISDDFAICMTDNPSLPPRCHYTASVINRDAKADIAILQLNSVDIFGKKVDFSALTTLSINMDYQPQSGDPVIARGYPWVGVNTITETQGIISGTAQYNEKKYLKTDTLIAGGNSGGPLIFDGKMIGVNTFLIGGGHDPSLGYSLLISEMKDFIQEAFNQNDTLQSNNGDFPHFLQKLETFSSQKKIVDPLVSIDLLKKYTIHSYIPATSMLASLADADTVSVSSFGFYHMRTPNIKNTSELEEFMITQTGGKKVALTPVSIGGREFYDLALAEDTESTKVNSFHVYISVVDETHLLMLYLTTPIPTKNTYDSIQKTVKDFLSSVSFPSTFVFPTLSDIKIPGADIVIAARGNPSILYDITEYTGVLQYSIENQQDFVMVRNYFGNFWSRAQISIFKNSFAQEDDSVDTWLKKVTESMYVKPLVKKKITYLGHEGFLVCMDESMVDEMHKNNDAIICEAVFLMGENNEFILSSQMMLPKKNLRRIDTFMIQYLKKTLRVSNIGETLFKENIHSVVLPYSDTTNQTVEFQEVLNTLLSHGILQNRPVFDGDAPLRWREYFALYVWMVYHKQMTDVIDPDNIGSPTFAKVLSVLPVVMDDYAEDEEWHLDIISDLIRLLVAGGSLPKYDAETIGAFSNAVYDEKSRYKEDWDMIVDFETDYFPKSVPIESAQYTATQYITYNPFIDLEKKPIDASKGMDFFRNNTKNKADMNKILQCDKSSLSYFAPECREMRQKSLLEYLSYRVLTKGRAIEKSVGKINLALWASPVSKNTHSQGTLFIGQ